MATFYAGAAQKINTVGNAVKLVKDNAAYTRLNYQFGTFEARRGSDVECGAFG